jgi:hypothetical protein
MGLEEVWATLDNLVAEFRMRGATITSHVMEDLRAAKTLIKILKTDSKRVENIPTIGAYLDNVESYLIIEAHTKFGVEFADEWMEKLKKARKVVTEEKAFESSSKFVHGLPRGKHWIRFQVSEETPQKYLEALADKCGLSYKMQDDGYILVYGDNEKLRWFIEKTRKSKV